MRDRHFGLLFSLGSCWHTMGAMVLLPKILTSYLRLVLTRKCAAPWMIHRVNVEVPVIRDHVTVMSFILPYPEA